MEETTASVSPTLRSEAFGLELETHGDVSCTAVTKAVEKYIDFEAFVYWLRPLFQTAKIQLPANVTLN